MAAALEECCGLGCNNCILDQHLDNRDKRSDNDKIVNLFSSKGYQKFKVKAITKERSLVYKFTFELLCDRDEPYRKDEQLIAPPVSYLMLRAPRNFDEIIEDFNPLLYEDFKDLMATSEDEDKSNIYYRSEPQRFDKSTPEIYLSRKYTPYEVNEELRTFKIIVKLEKFGTMSKYFTKLNVESVCEFKGPFEAFNYVHEKIENYIVFTQGKWKLLT